jgi:hypothetical protein
VKRLLQNRDTGSPSNMTHNEWLGVSCRSWQWNACVNKCEINSCRLLVNETYKNSEGGIVVGFLNDSRTGVIVILVKVCRYSGKWCDYVNALSKQYNLSGPCFHTNGASRRIQSYIMVTLLLCMFCPYTCVFRYPVQGTKLLWCNTAYYPYHELTTMVFWNVPRDRTTVLQK